MTAINYALVKIVDHFAKVKNKIDILVETRLCDQTLTQAQIDKNNKFRHEQFAIIDMIEKINTKMLKPEQKDAELIDVLYFDCIICLNEKYSAFGLVHIYPGYFCGDSDEFKYNCFRSFNLPAGGEIRRLLFLTKDVKQSWNCIQNLLQPDGPEFCCIFCGEPFGQTKFVCNKKTCMWRSRKCAAKSI